jgi:hypothetical protein
MNVSPNAMFLVSGALFIVWMQRHKRWQLMIRTMDGQYHIRGTK